MTVYCITGTNRGLGLEFVRQLAQSADNTILATTRESADLTDLKAVASPSTHILSCDTENPDSIKAFAQGASKALAGKKIDFLLNVAGINSTPKGESSLALVDLAHLHRQIDINVVGPAKVVEYFLGANALSDNLRLLNMTSGLGSMEVSASITPRKCLGYSISKAGLNMLTVHMASDLKKQLPGAVTILMDPGWVKTRMGGEGAVLDADVSISGMLKVLHGLTDEENGKFFNYDGTTKPW